jgi:hypothetical protein
MRVETHVLRSRTAPCWSALCYFLPPEGGGYRGRGAPGTAQYRSWLGHWPLGGGAAPVVHSRALPSGESGFARFSLDIRTCGDRLRLIFGAKSMATESPRLRVVSLIGLSKTTENFPGAGTLAITQLI